MDSRSALPIPARVAAISPDGHLTPRQRRHLKLEIVRRRQKPGTGTSLEALRRRTAMNSWPDLRGILEDIPWVVVGGVATRAYMPERMTNDLDILVRAKDGVEVRRRLESAGYRFVGGLLFPGVILRSLEGIEVDIIYGDDPWLGDALARPESDPAGFPVIALPYLILLKMRASRDQDWTDITRMLGQAGEAQLEQVRSVVARYSPEDSEDLETMIYIGKREYESSED